MPKYDVKRENIDGNKLFNFMFWCVVLSGIIFIIVFIKQDTMVFYDIGVISVGVLLGGAVGFILYMVHHYFFGRRYVEIPDKKRRKGK